MVIRTIGRLASEAIDPADAARGGRLQQDLRAIKGKRSGSEQRLVFLDGQEPYPGFDDEGYPIYGISTSGCISL
jgi:hypothetical protein